MADDPRLNALVAGLPATVPFTGPEALERRMGHAFAARLGANESGFGPSPAAVAAMRAAAADVWMYGDPEAHDLRAAIARHHGVDPGHIYVGEGIDGILGLVCRMVLDPGAPVVTSLGGYPTFNFHVAGMGGAIHPVPYAGDHEDPVRLVAKAREQAARLVYFANPDNPMGSWHEAATVARMIDNLPGGALLLLDEAYVELAPPGTAPEIDPADPRVLRLRTFSKAHGLAGLRVGYAIGPRALIAAFDRVRNHFGLGRIAQAGALAAVQDRGWVVEVAGKVARARDRIAEIGRANGLVPLPSATNFVALDCGGDGAFATAVLTALAGQGVFVRKPGVAPLDRCIRVSCGPDAALEVLAAALPRALAEARLTLP